MLFAAPEAGKQGVDVHVAEHAPHHAAEGVGSCALLRLLGRLLLGLLTAAQETAQQTTQAGGLGRALLRCAGLLPAAQEAGEETDAGGSRLLAAAEGLHILGLGLGLGCLGELLAQQAHQQGSRSAQDLAGGRVTEPGLGRRSLGGGGLIPAQEVADDLFPVFDVHIGEEGGYVAGVVLRMGIQRACKARHGFLVVGLPLDAAEHGGQRGKQHGFEHDTADRNLYNL